MVSAIHEVNQWGRKDPFTPAITANQSGHGTEVQIYNADGIAITKGDRGIATIEKLSEFKVEARTTTSQTTINHLIQNPSTHYAQGERYNEVPIASTEYYNTTKEGDWWNPTIKTIYDPCPNGYRIPESGTYGNASNWTLSTWTGNVLTAGQIWNSNIDTFFPVSGQRSSSNGQLAHIGLHGFAWMSTPSNPTHGYNMSFSSSSIAPNNSNHPRSISHPTRCIKEQ